MCCTQPYTRHRTTINKTNNTTLYEMDTTIHKTQDDDKQDKKHNTVVSCVLSMVVPNTYSVVLFVLFIVVLCLVYGCVQHI
jgi:hypothetical protein